ncbi:MAG: hypothetical protein ACPG61_07025 [Paracoccaceae bacterium]
MSKVILKFTKSHGPYVKGDIAGFDPEKAAKLKGVTVAYVAKAEKAMDAALAKSIADGTFEKDARATMDELERRALDLKEREAALAEREAALDAPAGDGNGATDTKAADGKAKKAGGGEPPAQGSQAKS